MKRRYYEIEYEVPGFTSRYMEYPCDTYKVDYAKEVLEITKIVDFNKKAGILLPASADDRLVAQIPITRMVKLLIVTKEEDDG